jgi:hypothetical protein
MISKGDSMIGDCCTGEASWVTTDKACSLTVALRLPLVSLHLAKGSGYMRETHQWVGSSRAPGQVKGGMQVTIGRSVVVKAEEKGA